MTIQEFFLIVMVIIFSVPYLIWRLGKTDYWAPLVVVQICIGILLGPGVSGTIFPEYYKSIFNPQVHQTLNGIAWWSIMIFVWIAGIELDLKKAWLNKRDSCITAGLGLCCPLLLGCLAASVLMTFNTNWIGSKGMVWQFIIGVGMACAVTALPILILLMEKLKILREPIGQRIMRYASLDDIAIWFVLSLVLLDWDRVGLQGIFLVSFIVISFLYRKLMRSIQESDRWYVSFIWLAVCGLASDWAGLHFMVGAFLAGVVMDSDWFNQEDMDKLRHFVMMTMLPVYFMSAGLRTNWEMDGVMVFAAAAILLFASIAGKLAGTYAASKILKWEKGEAWIIGWLLQTKALIMIVFSNVLLDKQIITSQTFTALLVMAVASTMLTVPIVTPKLRQYNT
ncbi:MAG TPA: cation:proton antiporter [Nitrosomonas sp.]|mgnify:CR=1 FL=1|nr:cation:proton antiporter [Nitrosomonas sp.]HQX14493.1 cation:proton antiporter [Nitrosomonas sp.]HRB33378.1 cation:proton antiporter [Nitrosomonas sp.]HRB46659.1 cation:proton antiporter [Nitrosomonas sp.]